MSGLLDLRLDQSDFNNATVTLNSRNEGKGQRTGATLRLDLGKTVRIQLPEFLIEEDSEANEENKDVQIEKLQLRVKELEQLEENQLVASDHTDSYRIQTLTQQLDDEKKSTRLLEDLVQHLSADFESNLSSLRLQEYEEIEKKHGLSSDGKKDQREDSLKKLFHEASTEEKVDLLKESRVLSSDVAKEKARKQTSHVDEHEVEKESLQRFSHAGDKGANSSTEHSDVDTSAGKEENEEDHEANTSGTPLAGEDKSKASSKDDGKTGGSRADIDGSRNVKEDADEKTGASKSKKEDE